MFYRVPLSYAMLTLICYRIVDEEAIYITMYFTITCTCSCIFACILICREHLI